MVKWKDIITYLMQLNKNGYVRVKINPLRQRLMWQSENQSVKINTLNL